MLNHRTVRAQKAILIALAFICCLASVVCLFGCASAGPSSEQPTGNDVLGQTQGVQSDVGLSQQEKPDLVVSAQSPQFADAQAGESGSISIVPIISPSVMENDGLFSGYAIEIKGAGIERIQAHTDAGLLCKLDEETIVKSAEPDKWKELAGWKPTKRGTGEYFSAYDYVGIASGNGKEVFTDPDAECGIVACKVLGQTVDLNPAEGALLSFWLEPEEGSGNVTLAEELIESLSGARLTITATFNDGTVETQVVTLSPEAGDVQTAVANGDIALVGTVESLGDISFPFEGEPANVYENETLPAAQLPSAGAEAL